MENNIHNKVLAHFEGKTYQETLDLLHEIRQRVKAQRNRNIINPITQSTEET